MDFLVVVPVVDAVPELGGHEQGLQEAVDVAGGSDVGQPFIIAF